MTDTSSIRREMAETRIEMSHTAEDIKGRVTEPFRSAKRRLDVGRVIREHPWSAIGVAVAIGAAIGGSGADEAAAGATAEAAKRASRASVDAAKSAVEKVRARHEESELASVSSAAREKPGLFDRFFNGIGISVANGLDGILDEMRVASGDWGARMAAAERPQPISSRAPMPVTPPATAIAPATPIAAFVVVEDVVASSTIESAADTVPVPNEMPPSELDVRADAVEAMGGGTHEPPLEPGAGDLGARWS
jgi:hypothetical protein